MPTVPEDLASWMRFIPDDYSVTQLTIPGTHDTHATSPNYDDVFIKKDWAITQSESITRQLDMGVRYLDFRIGNPNFSMYHGQCKLKNTLMDTCQWVNDWLGQHPTETVLIAVKWDQDDAAQPDDFTTAVWDRWKPKSEGGYGWYAGQEWPKLKDVRGKAVLLRRYENSSVGIDLQGFWGEEQHHDSPGKWDQQDDGKASNMEREEVWRRAWNHLNYSRDEPFGDNVMHFTGLAQAGVRGTPERYADWINPALMRHLHDGGNIRGRYGVIIMDYIKMSHALTIVSKNWGVETHTADKDQFWTASSTKPVAEFTHWNGDKVSIMFQEDANLVVYRNRDVMWASGPTTEIANDHKLVFQSDGNLVIYKHGDIRLWIWRSDTMHRNSRVRFMSGPPYIMIDTDGDKGEIWWTTCPW